MTNLNSVADSYSNIMAHIVLSDAEKFYIINGIDNSEFRADGRNCEDYRVVELETGVLVNTNGSSRLRLGNTELLTGVKVELGVPNPKHPNQGWVEFHVDCSPNAGLAFQGRGGQDLSNGICSHLSRIYNNHSSLDLSQLCIVPGRHCWVVHVDVIMLEYGGNLFDAVSIAVKAALHNIGVPKVSATAGDEGEYELNLPEDPSDVIKLKTSSCPVLVTISKIGNHHVVDATLEEEFCSHASLIVGVTAKGLVTGVKKAGSGSLCLESINEMLETAKKVGKRVNQGFNKHMKLEKGMSKSLDKVGYL